MGLIDEPGELLFEKWDFFIVEKWISNIVAIIFLENIQRNFGNFQHSTILIAFQPSVVWVV